MTKAPIAVIGTGSVGRTLARGWALAGHPIRFGSRDPDADRVRQMVNQLGPGVRAEPAVEAAASAGIIVLAVPWSAACGTVSALGSLADKILIDCTNPLRADLSGLEPLPEGSSGAEQVAGWAKGARVVKAFNTVGFKVMAQPALKSGPAAMPICGNDPIALVEVAELARELGFAPLDAGLLASAGLLESLALLWIRLGADAEQGGAGLGLDWAFCVGER